METVKFEDLGLSKEIKRAVDHKGYAEASPIQAKAIPVFMEGRDLIGQAQTGTGKTAAFGIPMLEKIDPASRKLQAIALCPTRELAIQVSKEIRDFAKYMHGVKVVTTYGGQPIQTQIRALRGAQIVIGTPGRVMDHLRRRTMKTKEVSTVILDEADEMLNMGFREDIETILKQVPEERQTILFSATMPKAILEIAKEHQKDAKMVKVVNKELTVANIEQCYYEVRPGKKADALVELLHNNKPNLSLVFCNTKRRVDELVILLNQKGFRAAGLHGDLKQKQRDYVMNSFRRGQKNILIATDVAARGIDVDNIEAVINYDLPQDIEYYVHRIGRTGRCGRSGIACSFIWGKDIHRIREIQRFCKTKIVKQKLPVNSRAS